MFEASHKLAAASASASHYRLQLYVAGPAPRSVAALRNLEAICAEHLPGRHHIEVIDLMKNPHLAKADNILAVPTLVRSEPDPVRKIIGNLANPARVLSGLDLCAFETDPFARRKGGSHV
jgi:circadian clock protein KaiB